MKTKKRVLAIALAVALIAIISIGTLAWFTDSDEVTNVFTLGEVSIGLHDLDGEGKNFVDNPHPILPGVPVDKIVYATNDGDPELTGNDAYIRTFIGIPEKLDGVLVKTWDTTGDWTLDKSDYIAELEGVRYKVYQFTYTGETDGKLAAGGTTAPVLSKIELREEVDCKGGKLCVPDPEAEGGYRIFDFDINELRELKVPVAMQAVQTAGFADADKAFDAAFNGCPWTQAAPEQNQEENPADINVIIQTPDLNKDNKFTWNAPKESGFEKLIFNIPAGTFDVPVKATFEASMDGNSPSLVIKFVQIDEKGDEVMDGDEPVLVSPDWDKLKIEVHSPYPKVGDETHPAALIGIESGNPFTDAMNTYMCCDPWIVTGA